MREVTITAKTVEMAIEQGLAQLEAKKEDVTIHTIDYGKKSFLGVFGGKPAIVRLSLKEKSNTPLFDLKQLDKVEKISVKEISLTENEVEKIEVQEFHEIEEIQKRPHDQMIEEVKVYLKNILQGMDISSEIEVKVSGKEAVFKITGKDVSAIIGRRGQILNSLQYLCQLVLN